MPYVRAKLNPDCFGTNEKIVEFITELCDGTCNYYTIENFKGNKRVNARSLLGMIYAVSDFDELYLINDTEDGVFAHYIDKYRL